MSRKAWIILIVVVVSVLLLVGVGAAGAFAYLAYRDTNNLNQANQAYAAKNLAEARLYYALYLARHPGDLEVLPKYAEASLGVMGERRSALRNTGTAYFQIAKTLNGEPEAVDRLLQFWEKHAFWQDLEYCADFFLRQGSKAPRLAYWRAYALDRQGRSQEAMDNYSVLIEAHTNEFDAYGAMARLQNTAGFGQQADATLALLRQLYPKEPRSHLQFVRYYMSTNRIAEARIEIDKALEGAPDDVDILIGASQIALHERRWADALAYAEKAISVRPDRGEGYILLLTAHEKEGEPGKALERLAKLPRLMLADNPDLFLVLAELQIGKGLFDDAHKTIEDYRVSYPDQTMIFEYLAARELMMKGLPKEAAGKFAAVTKSIPDFGPAQYYLAAAYLQSNRRELAQAALEVYLRVHPEDERARLLWNSTFGAPQSSKEALTGARKLLADEATAPESCLMAADAIVRQPNAAAEDVDLARQLIERAIQRQPAEIQGYLASVELAIITRKDKAPTQSDAVERARAAGIADEKLYMLKAATALLANDSAKAYSFYTEDLGRADIDVPTILRWARLLARHDSLATGLRVLSDAMGRVPEDRKPDLQSEQISMCTSYGDNEQALRLLESAGTDAAPETAKRLGPLRLRLAEILLRSPKQEDRDKANVLMEEVVKADPERTDVRALRAQFYLDQEPPDFASAEALGASAIEADPKDTRALLLMAEVTARKGQYSRALNYARQAASVDPQNTRTQIALAQSLMQMQRNREAVQALEGVVSAHPDDKEALEMLVRAYGADNQGPQAEQTLEHLASLAGSDPQQAARLGGLRGWLQLFLGRFGEAEKFMRAQLEANPDDSAANQGLASALAGQGRIQEASDLLRRYAEKHGASPEAWTGLARFYLSRNDPTSLAAASSALTRALLAVPDYAPALRGQIEVQARSGNAGAALGLCERYLQAQPDDVEVLFQWALLLARDRHGYQKALEAMDRAILQDKRPNYLLFRGTLQVDMGRYREALADLQEVAGAQGVTPPDLDIVIAQAHAGLKEYDVAKLYYDSARQKESKGSRANADRLALVEKVLREQGVLKP